MKNILTALLGFVVVSTVFAEAVETTKAVICDNRKDVFTWIQTNEYNEKLTWIGDSPSSKTKFALLANNETGTWTIIEFDDKYACVVDVGVKSKLAPIKPIKNSV